MVEDAAGHRVLLAPDERVRDFVAATYTFDEHVIEPGRGRGHDANGWQVTTPSLSLRLGVGGPTPLGAALALVPTRAGGDGPCLVRGPSTRSPACLLRGVRTRGTGRGRAERAWYGATSVVAVTDLAGTWRGADLGRLAPVDPPCRFGFSSTPSGRR